MTRKIIRSLLPPKYKLQQTLETPDGHVDILGQLLYQEDKSVQLYEGGTTLKYYRLPSQTGRVIFPYTVMMRGMVVDTPTTLEILSLDSLSNRDKCLETQRILLERHNIIVEIEE